MNYSTIEPRITPSNSVDLDEHLLNVLGPVRIELQWLIPLTSFYCVIFATGIVGNTCTCMVIARNQYMQTATNCYLFNLAVADMLTLLCGMPLELYTLWHQYPWQLGLTICQLKALISEATAYASILTIVTFSMERYIAICHPIRQQTKSKLGRAVRNITIIWILSLVGAAPFAVFSEVNYINAGGKIISKSAWCGFPFNNPDRNWETLMLCSTFLFFLVPMTMIIVLYALIAVTLRESRNIQRSASESRTTCRTDSDRFKSQSRRIVVRMLVAVVLAFFICWAPFHSQRLLFIYVSLYGHWSETLRKVNQYMFLLAGCFYYSNSTINPILYSVMSNRFRVAFREKLCNGSPGVWCLLCCCCCCWRHFTGQDTIGKRSQQRVSTFRNSNSQSSVKSQITYPANNTVRNLPTNNSFPRGSSSTSNRSPNRIIEATRLEHSDSFPIGNVAWTRNPHYESVSLDNETSADRRTNIRSNQEPPNEYRRHHSSEPNFHSRLVYKRNNVSVTALSVKQNNIEVEVDINNQQSQACVLEKEKDEDEIVLAQELEQIIGPEIAKLAGEKEGAGCLNCTNCNLLFHASNKSVKRAGVHKQEYLPVSDGTAELSLVESTTGSRGAENSSSNTTESCV